MKLREKKQGFTLIELLVTVALVGLLLLVGLPFTSEWVTSADMQQTQSRLQQAISMAKSRAMRNANGISAADSPVAVVCAGLDGDGDPQLEVREVKVTAAAGSDPCVDASSDSLWSTKISAKADLKHLNGAQALSYIIFDNRGSLVTSACPTPNACATTNQLQIAAHGSNGPDPIKLTAF